MLKKIKSFYIGKLQDKNITVKGKQIPLAVVFFISFIIGLVISELFPSHFFDFQSNREVNYNHNGIKIIGLNKCDTAICGYVQNKNEWSSSKMVVAVNFIKNNNIVYTNKFAIPELKPQSTLKIKIPSQTHFTDFQIKNIEETTY